MPNEASHHAVARGRDVSFRCEGGHSPENHSGAGVVLETTDGPQRQRPLRPVLTVSRTRCGVGGAGEASRRLKYHKVSLERIRDKSTAKEQVEKEKYRRNHSQGASGENPTQNHGQRASGEKNEVKQHGYKDSEKNIEATMRSQSSAPRREGEK